MGEGDDEAEEEKSCYHNSSRGNVDGKIRQPVTCKCVGIIMPFRRSNEILE